MFSALTYDLAGVVLFALIRLQLCVWVWVALCCTAVRVVHFCVGVAHAQSVLEQHLRNFKLYLMVVARRIQ